MAWSGVELLTPEGSLGSAPYLESYILSDRTDKYLKNNKSTTIS